MSEWTTEDIDTLKKLAESGASRLRIAAKMRRTMIAITATARQHGIRIKSLREVRTAKGLTSNWAGNRDF